jgi:hypothetical protein
MVASLVAIALHNPTGLSDLEKECPLRQVKSRVANSDCSTSGDRPDIGYSLSGKACSNSAAGDTSAMTPLRARQMDAAHSGLNEKSPA